jgi:hypothetical protein
MLVPKAFMTLAQTGIDMPSPRNNPAQNPEEMSNTTAEVRNLSL